MVFKLSGRSVGKSIWVNFTWQNNIPKLWLKCHVKSNKTQVTRQQVTTTKSDFDVYQVGEERWENNVHFILRTTQTFWLMSIKWTYGSSLGRRRASAVPRFPIRAVRPQRWTNWDAFDGASNWKTQSISAMSIPRAMTSVQTNKPVVFRFRNWLKILKRVVFNCPWMLITVTLGRNLWKTYQMLSIEIVDDCPVPTLTVLVAMKSTRQLHKRTWKPWICQELWISLMRSQQLTSDPLHKSCKSWPN